MRGRTATPAAVKKARGTDRKSRAKADVPVLPVAGSQPPPKHLSKLAAAAWQVYCPLATSMRVLTQGDLLTLERLCECSAEVRELTADVKKSGRTYMTENGLIKANPAVAMLADADRRLLAYLTNFGMTPAARSKVAPTGDGKDENPNDEFFGGVH